MKLNLDVIDPNQPLGNAGAVSLSLNGKNFTVVRNQDSYTVRQG